VRDNALRGLKTFCTAARHLSFKQAAEELHITPSAVSHQIKVLESLLGVTLFERLTREVALTDAGAALFARVDPLLREIEEATDTFVERARNRRVLRITLMPFFASEMFIPRLSGFTQRHGELEIRVETTEAGGLHPPGSDASILLLPSPPSGVCAHPLFSLRLVPAAAPALLDGLDLQDPAALLRHKLIVHKARPKAWRTWLSNAGVDLDADPDVLFLDSMFAVARAAERGLGVALVPVPLSNSWFASGSLVKANPRELKTPDRYYFVYRRDAAASAGVRALRDWVVETFSRPEKMSAVA
jgi:LysR family glycine cleavage system transcriptional activator